MIEAVEEVNLLATLKEQIIYERAMSSCSDAEISRKLGCSKGRVSQVLNTPEAKTKIKEYLKERRLRRQLARENAADAVNDNLIEKAKTGDFKDAEKFLMHTKDLQPIGQDVGGAKILVQIGTQITPELEKAIEEGEDRNVIDAEEVAD